MQTEPIIRERGKARFGSTEAERGALKDVFVEREFLRDRFSLRAQFDWKVARQTLGQEMQADGTDAQVQTVFRSPSERVFTPDRVIEFLSQVRKMTVGCLGTRHASTPQISVFRRGHHAWVEKDASIAPWRYMYFLGPRGAGTSIVMVIQTREPILGWLPRLTRTRTAKISVGVNDLIIYRSTAMQSVLCQPQSVNLEDQTVLLSGWLW